MRNEKYSLTTHYETIITTKIITQFKVYELEIAWYFSSILFPLSLFFLFQKLRSKINWRKIAKVATIYTATLKSRPIRTSSVICLTNLLSIYCPHFLNETQSVYLGGNFLWLLPLWFQPLWKNSNHSMSIKQRVSYPQYRPHFLVFVYC